MPTMTVKQSQEFEEIEDGAYDATIEEAEEVEGEYGPQFKFYFRIVDGPRVTAYCSQTLSTKSKLFAWASAILGDLKVGQDVDVPADLIGKPCRILVSNEQNAKGDIWPRVKKVAPPKAKKPNGKAPASVDF